MERVVLVIDFGVHADARAKDRCAILPVTTRINAATQLTSRPDKDSDKRPNYPLVGLRKDLYLATCI
jgi:hypothetical protein